MIIKTQDLPSLIGVMEHEQQAIDNIPRLPLLLDEINALLRKIIEPKNVSEEDSRLNH